MFIIVWIRLNKVKTTLIICGQTLNINKPLIYYIGKYSLSVKTVYSKAIKTILSISALN